MAYFPFYTDISKKTFLIVGGGRVAQEKVNRLRRFTEDIIVIAPDTEITQKTETAPDTEIAPEISGGLQVLRREYQEDDLEMADYVVAATGIQEVDRKVAEDCRLRGIPVNVVDDRDYCDFIFPAIVKRGDLTVAISTGGTSPAYARQLRQEIEEILPPEIEGILARMGEVRSEAAERISDQKNRAAFYKKLLAELIASGNTASEEEVRSIIEEFSDEDRK